MLLGGAAPAPVFGGGEVGEERQEERLQEKEEGRGESSAPPAAGAVAGSAALGPWLRCQSCAPVAGVSLCFLCLLARRGVWRAQKTTWPVSEGSSVWDGLSPCAPRGRGVQESSGGGSEPADGVVEGQGEEEVEVSVAEVFRPLARASMAFCLPERRWPTCSVSFWSRGNACALVVVVVAAAARRWQAGSHGLARQGCVGGCCAWDGGRARGDSAYRGAVAAGGRLMSEVRGWSLRALPWTRIGGAARCFRAAQRESCRDERPKRREQRTSAQSKRSLACLSFVEASSGFWVGSDL